MLNLGYNTNKWGSGNRARSFTSYMNVSLTPYQSAICPNIPDLSMLTSNPVINCGTLVPLQLKDNC